MKGVIGVILVLITIESGVAQSRTHIGVLSGGNFSSVYFNHLAFPTNIRTTVIPGVFGGVAVKYFPHKRKSFLNTAVQLGANYQQKGYIQQFPNGHRDYNVRLNYLTVPFSAIVYAGKGKLKIFLSPGIYGEFIQNVDTNGTPEDDDPESEFINVGSSDVFEYDPGKDFNKGFGVVGEVGIWREFGFGIIHLSGEVSYSLTNIIDFGDRSSGIPDTSSNYVVGFRVGYFIGIGKLEL